jgi:hypothetical protein
LDFDWDLILRHNVMKYFVSEMWPRACWWQCITTEAEQFPSVWCSSYSFFEIMSENCKWWWKWFNNRYVACDWAGSQTW